MPSSDVMLSVTRRVVDSPKCDNAFRGRAPSGQLQRSPEPLAAIGGAVLLLSGYEERGSSAQSRAVVH